MRFSCYFSIKDSFILPSKISVRNMFDTHGAVFLAAPLDDAVLSAAPFAVVWNTLSAKMPPAGHTSMRKYV